MTLELSPEEARVLGALMEKQLTTPQQYPLTLNALIAACNQTSSRNPVVDYDQRAVEAAVTSLKDRRLLRFVHPSHGRSATRYRQVTEEVLNLEVADLALLAVLLLRGPQTVGDLRIRTERMASFAGVDEVERRLEAMAAREDPLVVRLPRQLGHKEARYAHLLSGEEAARAASRSSPTDQISAVASVVAAPGGDRSSSALAGEVAELRAEVATLRRELDELKGMLGV